MKNKGKDHQVNSFDVIQIRDDIASHLDLFHRCALQELVTRGKAVILHEKT